MQKKKTNVRGVYFYVPVFRKGESILRRIWFPEQYNDLCYASQSVFFGGGGMEQYTYTF
jgi:hypothetical protein